jgi:hypothetical protein
MHRVYLAIIFIGVVVLVFTSLVALANMVG